MSRLDAAVRALRTWRDMRTIARSGLFDPAWYLHRYPDVAAAGLDPLHHYVTSGGAEGRFANPIFDSRFYAARHLTGRAVNPLADYVRRGAKAGSAPNRWFDPGFYAGRHGISIREAMRRYLAEGAHDDGPTAADWPVPDEARRNPDAGGHGSPLGAFLHDYRLVGAIDLCTSWYVRGWTHRSRGDAMVVSIHVNGLPKGSVAPWIGRPDVVEAKGLEARGFCFAFPRRLSHGDVVELVDEYGDGLRNCTTTYAIPPLGASKEHYPSRAAVAAGFLHGRGLEVGAFTQPTDLPPDRDVVFFDRFAADELRRFYDRDCGRPMMEPTYVGEAETLEGVPAGAFDFVIANHVIEHLLDPICFLEAVAVRLRVGGRAMIAAPDKRFCFDAPRGLTPFAHLVEDHLQGGARSQRAHFLERAETDGLVGEAALAYADGFDPATIHFHYHVWDAESFVAFIEDAVRTFALPFKLLHGESTPYDVIVILEKIAPR